MLVTMYIYGSHQPKVFSALESKANQLLITSDLMRSSQNVDQWLINCDFLYSLPPSMMCSIYLNSRNVSEFLQKIIEQQKIFVEPDLCYVEHHLKVLDRKDRGTCRKVVKMYKIQWNHRTEEEATWDTEGYLNLHFNNFLDSTSSTSISVSVYLSNLETRFFLRGVACEIQGV